MHLILHGFLKSEYFSFLMLRKMRFFTLDGILDSIKYSNTNSWIKFTMPYLYHPCLRIEYFGLYSKLHYSINGTEKHKTYK